LHAEAAERIVALRPYRSMEDFVRRTRLAKAELAVLAEIGALNPLGEGVHRREALWQIERAYRPVGPLFESQDDHLPEPGPLEQMTPFERLDADYRGSGMTTGPHPMHYLQPTLAERNVLSARDLESVPHGRRVRVGGAVITRQRPGTAKGFCFITLEDETGVSNLILTPDVFQDNRLTVLHESFLIGEGVLQKADGTIAVKTDFVEPMGAIELEMESHDFH
jgi:error-prone DNA polymerase